MWNNHRLNHSWRQCVAAMQEGVVTLVFVKRSTGGLREARATLDHARIPQDMLPTGRGRASATAVAFFDLDAGGWRAFRKSAFIGFYECCADEAS